MIPILNIPILGTMDATTDDVVAHILKPAQRPRRQIVALWLQHSQAEIQIGVKFSPGNGRVFNRPTGASIRRVQRLALRLAARDGWTCHPILACGPTDWQEFGWVLHRPRRGLTL